MIDGVDACFCAAARRAARRLTERYEAELGKAGLSASQFELMSLLAAAPRNGRSIAAALELDTTTISRNVKALTTAGYVYSEATQSDARQLLYQLTPLGRAVLRRAHVAWQRAQRALAGELGTGAAATLGMLRGLGATPPVAGYQS